jgi:hypothetical protein
LSRTGVISTSSGERGGRHKRDFVAVEPHRRAEHKKATRMQNGRELVMMIGPRPRHSKVKTPGKRCFNVAAAFLSAAPFSLVATTPWHAMLAFGCLRGPEGAGLCFSANTDLSARILQRRE